MQTESAPAPKITRLSKALVALLVAFFLVQFFVPTSITYLALIPGRTLPCIWNLVTAGFLSTNPVKLLVEAVALLFLARLIEPAYGTIKFLTFILIVDFFTCLTVFVGVYLAYTLYFSTSSGKEGLLYTEFSGFHGIIFGLLVALKQSMPEQEVKVFSRLSFKIKYVPSILLVLMTALCAATKRYNHLPFMYIGTYVAWLYLRYFQRPPDSQYNGDPSEHFKFSTFFPVVLHPVVDAICSIFSLVFRLKHPAAPDVKSMSVPSGPSILGSDVADANRRRERGAKALEERLGMKKHTGGQDVEAGGGAAQAHSSPGS